MKVLHLVQGYAPAVGGTEFLIQNISERLVSTYGDEVTVLTTTSFNTEGFTSTKVPQMAVGREVINGVAVHRLKVRNEYAKALNIAQRIAWNLHLPRNDILRTLYNGPILPGIMKEMKGSGADIVAASSFPLRHMQYAVKAKRYGLPVVLLGGLHPNDTWGFDRKDIVTAIRKADAYIAYTSYERDVVSQKGIPAEKIKVIGAGVDPALYNNGQGGGFRAKYDIKDVPVVAFVGQQGGHKGIHHLIIAMRSVWRAVPDAVLMIAGARTGFSTEIEKMISVLPERRRRQVIKLDGVTHEEKRDLLQACDVFASPSGFESFGITYLEAWMCGKPVIGTRSGAIPTVISEDKDGLLCDYGNTNELASLIIELIGDSSARERLAAAGMDKVRKNYTWDIVTERLRAVYEGLA